MGNASDEKISTSARSCELTVPNSTPRGYGRGSGSCKASFSLEWVGLAAALEFDYPGLPAVLSVPHPPPQPLYNPKSRGLAINVGTVK